MTKTCGPLTATIPAHSPTRSSLTGSLPQSPFVSGFVPLGLRQQVEQVPCVLVRDTVFPARTGAEDHMATRKRTESRQGPRSEQEVNRPALPTAESWPLSTSP